MAILQRETAEFLKNIEFLTPKTPPSEGYFLKKIGIGERSKRNFKIGNHFLWPQRKHFLIEEIKSGRFFDMIRMKPYPEVYCMVPFFHASSRQFGYKVIPKSIFLYFYFENLQTGIKITRITKELANK